MPGVWGAVVQLHRHCMRPSCQSTNAQGTDSGASSRAHAGASVLRMEPAASLSVQHTALSR